MAKKFPPPPADDAADSPNVHPRDGNSAVHYMTEDEFERMKAGEPEAPAGLHPEIIEAVKAGDRDALCLVLMRKGIGQAPVADLLLTVQAEAERLQPLADSEPERARELEELRAKQWQNRMTPELARAMNAHGEAKVACEELGWLHSAFPSLFGLKPIMRNDAFDVPRARILGTPPNAVREWFNTHHCEPMAFDSWRQVGRLAETPQKIRLRVAGGPRFR